MYIIIWNSDGDTYVDRVDLQQLLAAIKNGEYGDDPKFFDGLPTESNTNHWPEGSHLLIKCEIVIP